MEEEISPLYNSSYFHFQVNMSWSLSMISRAVLTTRHLHTCNRHANVCNLYQTNNQG